MKKRALLGMLCMMLLVTVFPAARLQKQALAESFTTQKMGKDIKQWVMDEANGLIYAVTDSSLLFIRMTDLSLDKEVALRGTPSDLDLAGGKLYVPLQPSGQIQVVDAASKLDKGLLDNSSGAFKIAIDGDKLFFLQQDWWSNLYEYNLEAKSQKMLNPIDGKFHGGDLAVNTDAHLLYLGQSGTTGSHLYAVSTVDYTQKSRTQYDNGYGFELPDRSVVFDGDDVFYAKHSLNASNAADISGDYGENIVFAKGQYALSDTSIFDRDKFVKIGSLPFQTDKVLMDGQDNIYLFSPTDQSIYRSKINITGAPIGQFQYGQGELKLDSTITDWVVDDTAGRIYAVSMETNKLLIIRASDLYVEREILIGSKPTDIEMYQGKLYIALSGGTRIAVTEPSGNEINTISVNSNPYRIQVGDGKIFYTGGGQWQYVQVLDIASAQTVNTVQNDANGHFYSPELKLDAASHKLYIAETALSGSHLLAIDTRTCNVADKSNFDNGYGFPYPGRNLVHSGTDLYFAKYRMDAQQLDTITASYAAEVTYAYGKNIFTKNTVYNGETNKLSHTLPFESKLTVMDGAGAVYLYNDATKTVQKYPTVNDLPVYVFPTDPKQFYLQGLFVRKPEGTVPLHDGDIIDRNNPHTFVLRFSQGVANNYYESVQMKDSSGQQVQLAPSIRPGSDEVEFYIQTPLMKNETYTLTIKSGEAGFISSTGLGLDKETEFKLKTDDRPLVKNAQLVSSFADFTQPQLNTYTFTAEQGPLSLQASDIDSSAYIAIEDAESGELLYDEYLRDGQTGKITLPKTGSYSVLVGSTSSIDRNNTVRLNLSANEMQFKELAAPDIRVDGITNYQTINNPADPRIRVQNSSAERLNVFVDGNRLDTYKPQADGTVTAVSVDPTGLSEGLHRLTVVAGRTISDNQSVINRFFLVDRTPMFWDVTPSHWSYKPVELMANLAYLNGRGDNSFQPDQPVTREEFAKMIAATLHLTANDAAASKFADVSKGAWSRTYIQALSEAGLIKGETVGAKTMFYPQRTITRAEAVTIIGRAVGVDDFDISNYEKPFPDFAKVPGWAQPSVFVLYHEQWVNGFENGNFYPQSTLTRAQAAKILSKFVGI